MNKKLLKELGEFSINDELLKKEEKIFSDKKSQVERVKSEFNIIDKEKLMIREKVFFYKKEIEKIKILYE